MAKSKVIDGFSYEFDSLGKIIAVFDHSDPTNPTPVNPKSKLYADQVRSNDALTAFNFNRYGGQKDSYEKSVELVPAQVAKDFYDKEKYKKAKNYALSKNKISLFSSSLSFLLVISLIVFNGYGIIDQFVSSSLSKSFESLQVSSNFIQSGFFFLILFCKLL